MNYHLTTSPSANDACLILGVFEDNVLPEITTQLDKETLNLVHGLKSKLSEACDLNWQSHHQGRSILVIHCGKKADYTTTQLVKHINTLAQFIFKQRIESAIIALPQVPTLSPDQQIEQMLLQFEFQRYQLLDYKTKHKKPYAIQSVGFNLPKANQSAIEAAEAIAQGVRLARDLANRPANVCTPSYLAEQAHALAKQHKALSVNVLDKETMQQMGMGALLAVGQGSNQPPKLIEVHYKGHPQQKTQPIILVGKGITFDSGGISIKPALGMEEMKYDMAGAASVLGTIKACASLNLPINVIGLLACAENMPSGTATKPGDIITSLSGQTIEITNTDAEGRLVLADALTYAERFNPHFVIDIATLTGAVIIALGHLSSGLMTDDDELADLILKASKSSQDPVWRLPLDSSFHELLESTIADMMNSSEDRIAGSIVAGIFLSKYTKKYRWAHLDVAGTAWHSGKQRTATGRPVPLLLEILRQVAHAR